MRLWDDKASPRGWEMDSGAGQALSTGHPLHTRRQEIDQRGLTNLLRVNHERRGFGFVIRSREDQRDFEMK